MATKTELEREIKDLKTEIRTLRDEVKTTEADVNGLGSEAYGIIMKKGGDFNLVSIKFDEESNKAAIEKVESLGPSLSLAASKVKHAVIDTLVLESKKER